MGYTMMGSWRGRGNQYIQLVKVLYSRQLTMTSNFQLFHMRSSRDSKSVLSDECAGTFKYVRVWITRTPGKVNLDTNGTSLQVLMSDNTVLCRYSANSIVQRYPELSTILIS